MEGTNEATVAVIVFYTFWSQTVRRTQKQETPFTNHGIKKPLKKRLSISINRITLSIPSYPHSTPYTPVYNIMVSSYLVRPTRLRRFGMRRRRPIGTGDALAEQADHARHHHNGQR